MTEDEYQKWVEEVMIRAMARKNCRDIQDVPGKPVMNRHYCATLEERLTQDDCEMLREMCIAL